MTSPQQIESLQQMHNNNMYSALYDLLSNKSTANRNSGVWALQLKNQLTKSAAPWVKQIGGAETCNFPTDNCKS